MNAREGTVQGVRWEYLRDLVLVLTQKEIKARYKHSWLGYAWSVANPLFSALVYYIAFGLIMRVELPNYALFLITGLFPWQWLAHSITCAPNIFLANTGLIKKVRFPRNILVISIVLTEGIHFVLSIPVILGFLLLNQVTPSWSWLVGIPLFLVAQFTMIYGLALTLASLNLFFRDLERLTALFITFLFFLTPIAYSSAMVPPPYRTLLYCNPVAPLMESWRELFLNGQLNWMLAGASYFSALGALVVGSFVYGRLSPRFAEVV